MKKFLTIAIVVTAVVGGIIYWQYTRTPKYSLWQAKKAIEQHDLAIIHDWKQFKLLQECDIPKIIIMHCSKHGQGNPEFCTINLDDYYVVFNSYKDQEKWGITCPKQRVIWHYWI